MTKTKKGFTIIEVVLVLAIAGLIFLMVFIALPALQRSQRNTRRRSDMARILSAFTEYAANNGGSLPTTDANLDNFVNKYIGASTSSAKQNHDGKESSTATTVRCVGDQFCDPDGSPYLIYAPISAQTSPGDWTGAARDWPNNHQIGFWNYAVCDDDNEGKTKYSSGGKNDIAIMYTLEGGARYCGDNQ